MRADRLVAILLMLQTRGQVTAAEVAIELEVSERTARRDLDALGMAGLPIYSKQGRNGGWQLAGGGRTDLSGLSSAEARALFLVAGPASTATPDVRSALRKLVRALPEPFRDHAQAAAAATFVDPTGWDQQESPARTPPLFDAVQQAVIEGVQLRMDYVARDRVSTSRVVHPLGLAAKGKTWYLVADTDAGMRTFRVDRITALAPTGEPVRRPADFDLEASWRRVISDVDERRSPLRARALVDPSTLRLLRYVMGTRIELGPTADDGRVEVVLRSRDAHSLAGQIAGFGNRLEVLDPPAVAERLAELGAQLVERYAVTGLRQPEPARTAVLEPETPAT